MRSALTCLKSSHWMTQPGHTSATPIDERLDQRVVVRPAQPRGAVAEVQRIGQQGRVVGADVERDRQRQRRMDAARRGVQRELADRDGHPAGALVAEPEDPLVVGDHDQPDVVVRALPQQLGDPVAVGRRDPGAAGAPDDVAELLAGAPDGRACRRSAGTPRGARRAAGRTASRCGPGAPPARCTARARRPCDARCSSSRSICSSIVRTRSGSRPRSRNASRFGRVEGEILGQQPAAEERRPGERDRRRSAGRDVVVRGGQRSHPARG